VRRARLGADRTARPDHRELDARRRDWDLAEHKVAARDDAVRDAAARLEQCEGKVTAALRVLSRRSAEHGLPTDRGRLRELSAAVDAFRDTADTWVDAHLNATAAAESAGQLTAQAVRSLESAGEQAEEAAGAEAVAEGLRARLEAVESTVGEDYRQVVARVAEAREALARCRVEELIADLLLEDLAGAARPHDMSDGK
jgi:hypothetical protein